MMIGAVVDFGIRDDISDKALYAVIPKAAIPVHDTWKSMAYDSSELEKRG